MKKLTGTGGVNINDFLDEINTFLRIPVVIPATQQAAFIFLRMLLVENLVLESEPLPSVGIL